MKKNQCLTVILALVMMLSCFGVNVSAAEECLGAEETISVVRATGKFDMEVRANRTVKAGSSFPLEVGEVVTIKATYSPFSASVDFGFYGLNTTTGSFDRSIEVTQRGHYYLAVRNNSSQTISVSGYVNY